MVGNFFTIFRRFVSNPAGSREVAVVPMPKFIDLFTKSATNGSGTVPTERQLVDQPAVGTRLAALPPYEL